MIYTTNSMCLPSDKVNYFLSFVVSITDNISHKRNRIPFPFTYDKEKTMQFSKTWFCLSSKFSRKIHTGSLGTMHYVVSIILPKLYDLIIVIY